MRSLLLEHERGQGMIEYSLVIALISLVVIAGLTVLGEDLSNFFKNFVTKL